MRTNRLLGREAPSCHARPLSSLQPQSSKESLKAETQNITNSFEELDAQVNSESGFSPEDAEGSETASGREAPLASAFEHHLSTQQMYELKTKLRCSCERGSLGRQGPGRWLRVWGPQTPLALPADVVNKAMLSCRRWFDQKHGACMQRIWVPLLNHLLCLPMKFKFFCSIAKGEHKGEAGGWGAPGLGI